MILRAVFILLLFISTPAKAATYWVSPTGLASWGSCLGSTPLSGTSACSLQTSFANAVADDVINFRGGTYSFTGGIEACDVCAVFSVSHAGSNGHPITFQAYTGETPTISYTINDGHPLVKVIGLNSYVTFSGFTIQATGNNTAEVCICGADLSTPLYGVIFQNNTMIGGSNPVGCIANNADMIYFVYANSSIIKNNILGPFTCDGISDNGSLIKLYRDYDPVITNNELHNSNAMGISVKGFAHNLIVSYNYFHGNAQSFRFNSFNDPGYADVPGLKIYHNVLYATAIYPSMNFNLEAGTYADTGISVYNNTIYNTTTNCMASTSNASAGAMSGLKWYNNICYTGSPFFDLYDSAHKTMAEEDHNNYYNSGSFSIHWGSTYNSLSAWQTSGALEGGVNPGTYLGTPNTDIASDPLFTNGSGNYSLLTDFNLQGGSPSKATGRSGIDMGANISLVGPSGAAAQLNISPTTGLTTSGNVGGSFSPSSQTYTLTNTEANTINWTASKTQSWVTLSSTSGSIAGTLQNPSASSSVTVSINSGANSLGAGSYSDTVTWTNTTDGAGNTTTPVSLTVNSVGGGGRTFISRTYGTVRSWVTRIFGTRAFP